MLEVIQGDCRSIMKTLPGGYDFIFADPPYNISNERNLLNSWNGYVSDKGSWDHICDYERFTIEWVNAAVEVLRPGGIIAIIGVYGSLIPAWMTLVACGLQFQSHLVWHKTNPAPSIHRRMFTHANEIIIIFSKGPGWTFNYEAVKELSGGKQMHNVVTLPAVRRIANISRKPERLLEILVAAFTLPGGAVLDPFLGTGTTAICCKRMGRSCTGIEIDQDLALLARRRIADAS